MSEFVILLETVTGFAGVALGCLFLLSTGLLLFDRGPRKPDTGATAARPRLVVSARDQAADAPEQHRAA
ncbi:MAG TPA: hypothetical protein VJY35_01620 [Candidatus Eisenbacteria bacterium]|nr:hypothetical protein [Candidatus Eisenbacteria bacterium]